MRKSLIAVAAIVCICAVGVIAYGMGLFDFDNTGKDTLRTDVVVGDYIEYEETNQLVGEKTVIKVRYEISAINSDGTLKVVKTRGDKTENLTMTKSEFLEEISDDSSFTGMDKSGPKVVSTTFGDRKCDVYSGDLFGMTLTGYVGYENRVIYDVHYTGYQYILKDTSLFKPVKGSDPDPEPAKEYLDIRTDLKAGNYYALKFSDSMTSGGSSSTTVVDLTSRVDKVNADGTLEYTNIQIVYGERSEYDYSGTVSEYLDLIRPTAKSLQGFTVEKKETIDTPWGKVECTVYMSESLNPSYDKAQINRFWIDADNGVCFKRLTTLDDANTSDGRHIDHLEYLATLTECNLIYKTNVKPVPPSGDYGLIVKTVLSVGDYFSFAENKYEVASGSTTSHGSNTTHRIVSMNGNDVTVSGYSEDVQMTKSEFMDLFSPDMSGETPVGTESITTAKWGIRECYVYSKTIWTGNLNKPLTGYMYVDKESGVCFEIEASATDVFDSSRNITLDRISYDYTLFDTSLLIEI